MKQVQYYIGRIVFWIGRPVIWWVLHGTNRTRVALVVENEILLIRDTLGDGRWTLPGGGIKHGESPAVAACREIREELGVTLPADTFISLAVETTANAGISYKAHFMKVVLPRKITVTPDISVADTTWVAIASATTLRLDTTTRRALELLQR
jgi:8-oxo-dGTP diphosphatase